MIENEKILQGCQNGDPSSQRKLYEMYSDMAYALCLRYVGDEEKAKDVLIEGFVKVFQEIGNCRRAEGLTSWIRSIMVHCAIDRFRKSQKCLEVLEDPEETTYNSDIEHTLDIKAALEQGLDTLTMNERMVFNMKTVEGYNFREIATMLREHESNIKHTYYRAMEIMRRVMSELLLEEPEREGKDLPK